MAIAFVMFSFVIRACGRHSIVIGLRRYSIVIGLRRYSIVIRLSLGLRPSLVVIQ